MAKKRGRPKKEKTAEERAQEQRLHFRTAAECWTDAVAEIAVGSIPLIVSVAIVCAMGGNYGPLGYAAGVIISVVVLAIVRI